MSDNNKITTDKESKHCAKSQISTAEELKNLCTHRDVSDGTRSLTVEAELYHHKHNPIYLVRCTMCERKWVVDREHQDLGDENMILEGECDHSKSGLVEKVEEDMIWAVCPDCGKKYPICRAHDPKKIDDIIGVVEHARAHNHHHTEPRRVEHVKPDDVFADGVMKYDEKPKMNMGFIANILLIAITLISTISTPQIVAWMAMTLFCRVIVPNTLGYLISASIHFIVFAFIDSYFNK